MSSEYLSLNEIAKVLGLSYITIYRWVKSGKLPVYKIGKKYRMKKTDLDKFLATSKVKKI